MSGDLGFAATQRPRLALNPAILWDLVKESFARWVDDYAPSMGAALSYYTIFSIAPLLLIVIAVAGLAFGEQAASGALFEQLRGLLGDEGAAMVQRLVQSASEPSTSVMATVAGLGAMFLGATTVLAELESALNRIWRAPPDPKGMWTMLRRRFLSLGLILAIGFLLLVSLVVSAAMAALSRWWAPIFGGLGWLLEAFNLVLSLALVTVLFAMIYKILPRVRIGWKDVWIGAGVTALLFTVGKLLIGLYLGRSAVTSGFGAAGSVVVLLMWVYYSAQIFLLGAEFTAVYAHRFGSLRAQADRAPASESRGPR
jgi:membrane protein